MQLSTLSRTGHCRSKSQSKFEKVLETCKVRLDGTFQSSYRTRDIGRSGFHHYSPSVFMKQFSLPLIAASVAGLAPAQGTITWSLSLLTSQWNHGAGVVTGWGGLTNKQSTGTAVFNGYDNENLVTVPLTATATFTQVGSAVAHSRNGQYTTSLEFDGIVFGNTAESDRNTGATFDNYGVLTIVFSQALTGGFTIADVDTSGWQDAVASEGWSTSTVGAPGTGIAASNVHSGSRLDALNPPGLLNTAYDARSNPGNFRMENESTLVYDWQTPISAVSFYIFNTGNTGGEHGVGLISFGNPTPVVPGVNNQLVPEPASVMLGGLGSVLLLLRRRRA